MKILRVGDIVSVRESRRLDIVQESLYCQDEEHVNYALCKHGAWFSREDLTFVRSDGGTSLVKYIREHGEDS